jgi:osmotically-inducible protein OsmY
MKPQMLPIVMVGALGVVVGGCEKRPEATDRPPAASTPSPGVADRAGAATQTVDVKLALSMDKTVDASGINVDTDAANKVVTLKGTVASAEQRARAEAIAAREATGYRIDNQLAVKNPTTE